MKKVIMILVFGMNNLAFASDGVFDINATCASVTCFIGDGFPDYPVTITTPGSYRLTSNLISNSTNTNVIEFHTDNITLDLNGFAIIGPKTCTGFGSSLSCNLSTMTADAIASNSVHNNITVKNGSIRGFDAGIALNGLGNKIEYVLVSENEDGMINPEGLIFKSIANRNNVGFRSIHNSLIANALIKDSAANFNKTFSAIAKVCSNVFFIGNGSSAVADGACLNYTHESTCQVVADCP